MWTTILSSKVYGSIGLRVTLEGRTSPKFRYRSERVVLHAGRKRYIVDQWRTPFREWQQQWQGGHGDDVPLTMYQDIAYGVTQSVTINGQTVQIQECYNG